MGFSAFRNLERGLLSEPAVEGLLGELPPSDAAAVLASGVALRLGGKNPVLSKICDSVVSADWPSGAGIDGSGS
jgi:hypothetical protein